LATASAAAALWDDRAFDEVSEPLLTFAGAGLLVDCGLPFNPDFGSTLGFLAPSSLSPSSEFELDEFGPSSLSKLKPNEVFPMLTNAELSELFPLLPLSDFPPRLFARLLMWFNGRNLVHCRRDYCVMLVAWLVCAAFSIGYCV
jgi:hypothetical protein